MPKKDTLTLEMSPKQKRIILKRFGSVEVFTAYILERECDGFDTVEVEKLEEVSAEDF